MGSKVRVGLLVLLLLAPLARGQGGEAPPGGAVRLASLRTLVTGPKTDRPLALAFLDESRLFALTKEQALILRVDSSGSVAAHLRLKGPRRAVRSPAALVSLGETGGSVWVLSNAREGPFLLEVDKDSLAWQAEAAALPWRGSMAGIRYKEGTDWLLGDFVDLGPGPFVALAQDEGNHAVTPDGQLRTSWGKASESEGARVGSTLLTLWPGALAASTAKPPGESDELLVLEDRPDGLVQSADVAVLGAIRAGASRRSRDGATVALVTEVEVSYRILLLSLEREAH